MKKLFSLFLFITCFAFAYGQGGGLTVSGIVTEAATGQPAAGITVAVIGGHTGATTSGDGRYTLSNLKPESELSFSFVGMKTQRVTVGARTVINIAMEEDAITVQDVVVVGYGSQRSKDLTAPIASIQGDKLMRQPTANAAQALQGQMAGVQVINGGAPGAGASIKIRGVGSMGDDTAKPLYVVDGVFVDNIDFVGSSDIETISVLKDASASAIYGVRAANGVVLITTKKGMGARKAVFTYDGYVGVQTPVNVMPMLKDKNRYVTLVNEANAGDSEYVPKNAADFPANTDWYDVLLRNAFTQNHSMDLSGATDATNYSFGINYFDQDGIMNADNAYQRVNLRARVEIQANKWLKIGGNTMVSLYEKTVGNEEAFRQAFVNAPVYPVYNDENKEAYPVRFATPQDYGFGNSYGNPMGFAYYSDNLTRGRKYLFSIFAEAAILDKNRLTFRTSYNQSYTSDMSRNYSPEYKIGPSQEHKKSEMTKSFANASMQILDNTLTYADRKGEHSYTVMVGQSTRMEKTQSLWGSAYGVPDNSEKAKYLDQGISGSDKYARNTSDGGSSYNGISFFTRGTYNYADRYLATVTFRIDGSSKYQQKWGYFPSVGLGWVITSENFMQNQKAFDYLKLRASWGMLGNDNIPGNSSAIIGKPGVETSGVFGDTLIEGVGAQTVMQNYLKWEVVNEYDLGIDFATLRNRLTGEIDGYYRVTRDVVFAVPMAGSAGVADLLSNNGRVLNAGVEVTLRWSDKVKKDFSYHVGANLTYVHNEVLELNGREYVSGGSLQGGHATRTQVGTPIGAFYGYKVAGVYQTKGEAFRDPVAQQPGSNAGDLYYKDMNGDKKLDSKDITYLGSPIPKLIGGLDLGFDWKGVDFGLTIYGQWGNKIYNAKRTNRKAFPDGNYDMDFYNNRWHGEGTSNSYPSAAAYNSTATQNTISDFFVEDGSYLRLQNVQIGYTFRNIKHISRLRIYVSGQRLFTLFGYNGFTPEVGGTPTATGIDNNVYPMQAIYSTGINLMF